mmetsp:Transcript_15525/g.22135  ORF Transcript_15525/g.22135 Transcript_15525/m.22135 type:complete len:85 (+) Transcript_15525:98-352(+)
MELNQKKLVSIIPTLSGVPFPTPLQNKSVMVQPEYCQKNPLELRGPLKLPFGQFEILFLDRDMRIIKTGQGYLAVNIREEDDWF